MAKKRRKKKVPHRRSGRATAAYRSQEYVMYVGHTEIGICEAWMIRASLTDGSVESTLRWLASQLERSNDWPELEGILAAEDNKSIDLDKISDRDLIAWRVLSHVANAQREHGDINNRDLAGCLRVVLQSIDAWTRGPTSRGYLVYARDFVTNKLGVQMQLVNEAGDVVTALDEVDEEERARSIDLDADPLAKVGEYLRQQPNDEAAQQAFAYRIMTRIACGETEGLIDLCTTLLDKTRHKKLRSIFLFALGRLQQDAGDCEQTVQTLRQAVTADPDYLPAWLALGDAYQAAEQFREAVHAYNTALDSAPDHMPTYDRLVTACQAAGDLETAVEIRQRQTSQFPRLLAPRYDLAQLWHEQAQNEPAAATKTEGSWLDKLVGRHRTPSKKYEQEMKQLHRHTPRSDWQFDDWAVWVRLRLKEEAYDDALFAIQKQREEWPNSNDEMLLLTAVTLEAAGRSQEAAAIWQDLLPSSPAMVQLYAIVEKRLGDLLPESSPLFTAATTIPSGGKRPYDLTLQPPETAAVSPQTTPDVRDKAIELLDEAYEKMEREDIKAASRLFQRAHDLFPNVDTLYGLGLTHMLSDRPQPAYEAFLEVVTLVDDDAEYWFNLGMAALVIMHIGRALQAFERSLKLGELDRETRQVARHNIKLLRQDVRANQRAWKMSRSLDDYVHLEDLFHRGIAAMDREEITVAIELFRACIAFNEYHYQSWGNLGVCLIERGDYEEAEAALEQGLAIEPDYEIARNNLVQLAQKRQDDSIETEIAIVNRPSRLDD
jgi:tetratricopeptide (TPR) repeat protein